MPATSANLGPGFDCLGLALGLFNEVEILPAPIFSVSIRGHQHPGLKKNNLFLRIFYETYEALGGGRDSFRFVFTNNIPFSRGLGSSSSIILAALAAAHHFASQGVDKGRLLNAALKYEPHPDNLAPALLGGLVISLVSGGEVMTIKSPLPGKLRAVVAVPAVSFSTAASRSRLPRTVGFKDAVFNLSHASFLTAALLAGRYELLREAAQDKLHEARRMRQLPVLFALQKFALANGALMSTLSGSGPSLFNLVWAEDAPALGDKMKAAFSGFEILDLAFDNTGLSLDV